MKQYTLFKEDSSNNNIYSSKIEAPVYEPKQKQPHVLEIFNDRKTRRLIREINMNTKISEDERVFLLEASKRHTIFNYEKAADYYAHASREMQILMENNALVIIDFEKAIQQGYVKLSDRIKKQFLEEYE